MIGCGGETVDAGYCGSKHLTDTGTHTNAEVELSQLTSAGFPKLHYKTEGSLKADSLCQLKNKNPG